MKSTDLIFTVIGVIVVGIVAYLVFILADSSFIDTVATDTSIVDKDWTRAHYTSQCSGKGGCTQVYNPATYRLSVRTNAGVVACSVPESVYAISHVNDTVTAEIGQGRFSGDTYCKGVL